MCFVSINRLLAGQKAEKDRKHTYIVRNQLMTAKNIILHVTDKCNLKRVHVQRKVKNEREDPLICKVYAVEIGILGLRTIITMRPDAVRIFT